MERVILGNFGLLGQWHCAVSDATGDEIIASVRSTFCLSVSDEMIKDRLYGGFRCRDHADRRHIYFNSGQYTYIGKNFPLERSARLRCWSELLNANGEPEVGFVGGIFGEDAPT